jgi:hypothetical protein
MGNYLIGFDKNTGFQNYWCAKGNETRDESYNFFKGSKSLGVGLYLAPDGFKPGDSCMIDFKTEKIKIASENEVKIKEKEIEHNLLLNLKIKLLNEEFDRRIQTIPAERRTAIIGRKKTNAKHYTETWQHFYQRCQNIRHDQKEIYPLDTRQSATWVVERIEKHSKIKDKIKKQILNMSFEELKDFKPQDDNNFKGLA